MPNQTTKHQQLEHTSVLNNLCIKHTIGGKHTYTAYIHNCPPQYFLEGIVSDTELCEDNFNLSNKSVYLVTDSQEQENYTKEVLSRFMETQISHIRHHLGNFTITDNPNLADKIVMITSLHDPRKKIPSILNDKFICENKGLIDKSIAQNKLIFIKISL